MHNPGGKCLCILTIDKRRLSCYNNDRKKEREEKKMTVICYETKSPVIYNKGTKYKSSCNQFLSYYTYKSQGEAQKEVDEINRTKPEKLWNGQKVNWTEVDHFFVSDQEEMY
jgi:hypothetical protein